MPNQLVQFYRRQNPHDSATDDEITLRYAAQADQMRAGGRDPFVEFPDWAQDVERIREERIKETLTVGDYAKHAVGELAGSAVRVAGDVPKVAATMLSRMTAGDIDLRGVAGSAVDAVAGAVTPDEDPEKAAVLNKSFIASDIPSGLGSAAGFMVGGGAAGLGARALGASARAARFIGVGGLGAASGFEQQYQDAKAHGSSEDDAFRAGLLGAGVGTTEVVPISTWLNRLDRFVPGGGKRWLMQLLKDSGKESVEEALQEAFQSGATDVIAQNIIAYDPDREMFKDLERDAAAGGVVGALFSALTHGAARVARGQTRTQDAKPAVAPAKPGAPAVAEHPNADILEDFGVDIPALTALAVRAAGGEDVKQELSKLSPAALGTFSRLYADAARDLAEKPDALAPPAPAMPSPPATQSGVGTSEPAIPPPTQATAPSSPLPAVPAVPVPRVAPPIADTGDLVPESPVGAETPIDDAIAQRRLELTRFDEMGYSPADQAGGDVDARQREGFAGPVEVATPEPQPDTLTPTAPSGTEGDSSVRGRTVLAEPHKLQPGGSTPPPATTSTEPSARILAKVEEFRTAKPDPSVLQDDLAAIQEAEELAMAEASTATEKTSKDKLDAIAKRLGAVRERHAEALQRGQAVAIDEDSVLYEYKDQYGIFDVSDQTGPGALLSEAVAAYDRAKDDAARTEAATVIGRLLTSNAQTKSFRVDGEVERKKGAQAGKVEVGEKQRQSAKLSRRASVWVAPDGKVLLLASYNQTAQKGKGPNAEHVFAIAPEVKQGPAKKGELRGNMGVSDMLAAGFRPHGSLLLRFPRSRFGETMPSVDAYQKRFGGLKTLREEARGASPDTTSALGEQQANGDVERVVVRQRAPKNAELDAVAGEFVERQGKLLLEVARWAQQNDASADEIFTHFEQRLQEAFEAEADTIIAEQVDAAVAGGREQLSDDARETLKLRFTQALEEEFDHLLPTLENERDRKRIIKKLEQDYDDNSAGQGEDAGSAGTGTGQRVGGGDSGVTGGAERAAEGDGGTQAAAGQAATGGAATAEDVARVAAELQSAKTEALALIRGLRLKADLEAEYVENVVEAEDLGQLNAIRDSARRTADTPGNKSLSGDPAVLNGALSRIALYREQNVIDEAAEAGYLAELRDAHEIDDVSATLESIEDAIRSRPHQPSLQADHTDLPEVDLTTGTVRAAERLPDSPDAVRHNIARFAQPQAFEAPSTELSDLVKAEYPNLATALQRAAGAQDGLFGRLAQAMARNIKLTGVVLRFVHQPGADRRAGWYDPDKGEIVVNVPLQTSIEDLHVTLIHESLHAYMVRLRGLFQTNPGVLTSEERAAMDGLAKVLALAKEAGVTWQQSTDADMAVVFDEFIAALSKPEFRAALAGVKTPNGVGMPADAPNLWEAIKRFIARLVATITGDTSSNALDDAVRLVQGIVDGYNPDVVNAGSSGVVIVGNATITTGPGLVSIGGGQYARIEAYHGTPHDVDRFSTSNVGTGEGAQVYGWGLYFAQAQSVAEVYRDTLTKARNTPRNWQTVEELAQVLIAESDGDRSAAKALAEARLRQTGLRAFENVIPAIDSVQYNPIKGNLYTVSIDAEEDELLDWDKPLSEQPARVQSLFEGEPKWKTGKELYWDIANDNARGKTKPGPKGASEELARRGIKGIKYLDQGSRIEYKATKEANGTWSLDKVTSGVHDWTGLGGFKTESEALAAAPTEWARTYNYVVFDDRLIKITGRNGEPVSVSEAVGESRAANQSQSAISHGGSQVRSREVEGPGGTREDLTVDPSRHAADAQTQASRMMAVVNAWDDAVQRMFKSVAKSGSMAGLSYGDFVKSIINGHVARAAGLPDEMRAAINVALNQQGAPSVSTSMRIGDLEQRSEAPKAARQALVLLQRLHSQLSIYAKKAEEQLGPRMLRQRVAQENADLLDLADKYTDITVTSREFVNELRRSLKATENRGVFGLAQVLGSANPRAEVASAVKAVQADLPAFMDSLQALADTGLDFAGLKDGTLTPGAVRTFIANNPQPMLSRFTDVGQLALAIHFAKAKPLVMNLLRVRSEKTATERNAINGIIKMAMSDRPDAFDQAIRDLSNLKILGSIGRRIVTELKAQKDKVRTMMDAARQYGEFLAFWETGEQALKADIQTFEKRLNAERPSVGDDQWEPHNDAVYFVPSSPTQHEEEFLVDNPRNAQRRVLKLGDEFDGGQVKRDAEAIGAWLKAHPEAQGTANGNFLARVADQLLKVRAENGVHGIQRGPDGWVLRFLGALPTLFELTDTHAGRELGRLVRKFQSLYSTHFRDSSIREWYKYDRLVAKAKRATGVGHHEEFLRQFYHAAWGYLETRQDLNRPGVPQDVIENDAMKAVRQFLTERNPVLRDNPKAWPAVENLLRQAAHNSDLLTGPNSIRTSMGLKVKEVLSNGTVIFREAIGSPMFTMSRRVSVETKVLISKHATAWNTIFKDASGENKASLSAPVVTELYEKDRAALVNVLKTRFTPDVFEQFVVPLAHKTGTSNFDGPTIGGVRDRADIANVMKAADAARMAGNDMLVFAETLHALEGGRAADLAEFVGQTMATFQKYYSELSQIAKVKTTDGDDVGRSFLDARQGEDFPREWLAYRTFGRADHQRYVRIMAIQAAYGDDLRGLNENLKAAQDELSDLHKEYTQAHELYAAGKTAEADAILNAGGKRAARQNAAKNLDQLNRAHHSLEILIKQLKDMPIDFRLMSEALGLIVSGTLQGVTTGVTDTISLSETPLRKFGIGSTARKFITGAWKGVGLEALGSFLQVFGHQLKLNTEFERDTALINRSGATDLEALGERRGWRSLVDRYLEEIGEMDSLKALASDVRREPIQGIKDLAHGLAIRGIRGARVLMETGLGRASSPDQSFATLKPLAPFSQIQYWMHRAAARQWLATTRNLIQKASEYFRDHPADRDNPNFKFDAKNINYSRRGWNKRAFEYLAEMLSRSGISLEDAARRQFRGEEPLSFEQVQAVIALGQSEILLDAGLTTRPAWARENMTAKLVMPLLGWALNKPVDLILHTRAPNMKHTGQAFASAMTAMLVGVLPLSLAYAVLRDEYEEEVIGKKANVMQLSGANWPLALLDNLGRVGTFGIAGDLVNSAINVNTAREFSVDSRVFAVSSLLNVTRVLSTAWNQDWTTTYQTVWRPLMMSLGGGGYLQNFDVINNVANLDNPERRVVRRIHVGNEIKAAGRELGLDMRIARGGMTSMPNPIKPWVYQMALAAYANDPVGFRESYQKALMAAMKERVGDDPYKVVADSFESIHPLKAPFKRQPTELDYRRILTTLGNDGTDVAAAVRNFNIYGAQVLKKRGGSGLTPFTGTKLESGGSVSANPMRDYRSLATSFNPMRDYRSFAASF